jgi:hypothetical protein
MFLFSVGLLGEYPQKIYILIGDYEINVLGLKNTALAIIKCGLQPQMHPRYRT